MFRFPRLARFAAAGALAVSSFSLFAASPASAASTLSFADDGVGGVVVTYTVDTDMVAVEFYPAGTTCQVAGGGTLMVLTNPGGPPGSELASSPATLTFGTPVWGISAPQGATTIPAGTFTLCGMKLGMTPAVLDQIEFTFSADPVTTTTSSTTTTTASSEPSAPTFTG